MLFKKRKEESVFKRRNSVSKAQRLTKSYHILKTAKRLG